MKQRRKSNNSSSIQVLRKKRFEHLLKSFESSPEIMQMNSYIQHGQTTTLDHCKNVAWICFLVNEMLHLHINEYALVEAAILHDFYLYDWHDGEPCRKTHGFDHPEIACKNAVHFFKVSERTQDAIMSHMWPLTFTKIPKSKKALVLCLADKYCALLETLDRG